MGLNDEQMRRAVDAINSLSVEMTGGPAPWLRRLTDLIERGDTEGLKRYRAEMIEQLEAGEIADIAIHSILLQWIAAQDENE